MTDTPVTPRAPLQYLIVERLTQPQFLLSILSGVFLAWLTNRLLSDAIPENARDLVGALVGFISGQMVGPGWQFYFGTTQGSEKKTAALSDNAATLRRATDMPDAEPRPVVVTNSPADPVHVEETKPTT